MNHGVLALVYENDGKHNYFCYRMLEGNLVYLCYNAYERRGPYTVKRCLTLDEALIEDISCGRTIVRDPKEINKFLMVQELLK